jgi:thiamine pyrophosphokinase
MTAIIVCNGSINDYSFYKKYFDNASLVVCADGAASHLMRFGIKPDILVGDFDSILLDVLKYYKELGVEVHKFKQNKDMTDTELAIHVAIERGSKDIVIVGGTGTRLDHSLSNIFLLKRMLDKGITGRIINEQNKIVLTTEKVRIEREEGFKITLLSLTEKVEGVVTRGLLYPLNGDTLYMGESRGVSNEFLGEVAEVSIKSGILMIIKSKD